MNRLLYGFWKLLDVSDNIQRAMLAIRGIHGPAALILLIALALIDYNLFWLMVYFDLGATAEWSQKTVAIILPVVPASLIQYTSYLVVALTLLPTLTELFSSRFAQAGIVFAEALIFAMTLFDAITDWPRVVAFCEIFRPLFADLGLLAGPTFAFFRAVWLFMATFGFETLFVVFAICLPVLLLNVRLIRPAPTARPEVYGYEHA